jgi:3-oxoacyl-[acyl-carrier protein] reductase
MVTAAHTAIVTGANHGIGAATAQALAGRGCAVLCTFLRVDDPDDPGTPQAYRDQRAQDATAVVARIRDEGGRAAAVEADLSDPAVPVLLFGTAEEQFGPVDILVNNATGWLADTFAAAPADRLGRSLQPVTAETWTRQFTVDAMGAALMISEFARRHIARQATWGWIIGLTSGSGLGFPKRSPTERPKPPRRTTRCQPPWSSPRSGSRPTWSTRPSPTPAGSPAPSASTSP